MTVFSTENPETLILPKYGRADAVALMFFTVLHVEEVCFLLYTVSVALPARCTQKLDTTRFQTERHKERKTSRKKEKGKKKDRG